MSTLANLKRWSVPCIAGLSLLALAACVPIAYATYSGSLISTDLAILGTGNWIQTGPTALYWDISQNRDDSWHYSYVFSHPSTETRSLVLETSPSFTCGDLMNPAGNFLFAYIGNQPAGGLLHPTMPEDMYGVKFVWSCGLSSVFEFDTFREPMWGDFYAVGHLSCQDFNSAWNAGFTANDWDPDDPVQSGTVANHILVPDTGAVNPIPEPSLLILMGAGLVGSVLLVRRKRA